MLQFFRLKPEVSSAEYRIISGKEAAKFFAKGILYIVLFLYSTVFLAAAFPFVATPFYPVYVVGGAASAICIARVVNSALQYRKYKGGFISFTKQGVVVRNALLSVTIPSEAITYLERNVLGNLVVHEKQTSTSFPIRLLTPEDKAALLEEIQDIAPKRTNVFKKIWDVIDAVAVALVLAVHIIQYVIQAFYIPTASMEDTLLVGDHLFVDKTIYGPYIPQMIGMDGTVHLKFLARREIKRGDIIVFRPPHEPDKDYVKRCVAVPGDLLELKNGFVYINGERQDEPYTDGKPTFPQTFDIDGIVPEGKVVGFGDNRTNSDDSRFWGYIDMERIKGRAFVIYWNSEYIFKRHDFSRFSFID